MKAILVVNMPKNCAECKFRFNICSAVDWDERPSWCPLKPIPQKLDEMSNIDSSLFCQNMKGDQFCIGWNECLEEIEK